jgi:predicted nucleic acid-binding protein
VSPTARKYVLDTQIFIDAFRDPITNDALQRFHRAFAPFEYLSVVVAQELRAGLTRERDRKALERNVLGVFERAGRTFAPTASAWRRAWRSVACRSRSRTISCWRCRVVKRTACS